MAGKAAEEDDLYALAAKAGSTEAEAGFLERGVLFEPDSPGGVKAPAFETRVKAPGKTAPSKDESAKSVRPLAKGTAAEKQASDVADTLEEKGAVIFGLLTSALPLTGVYATENSPKAIRALVDIGKRRPAVMRALLKVADGADSMEIAKFVLGIATAVQVDLGRIPPDTIPARAFGVTEIYERFFADPNEKPANDYVTEQAVNVSRFQPIS